MIDVVPITVERPVRPDERVRVAASGPRLSAAVFSSVRGPFRGNRVSRTRIRGLSVALLSCVLLSFSAVSVLSQESVGRLTVKGGNRWGFDLPVWVDIPRAELGDAECRLTERVGMGRQPVPCQTEDLGDHVRLWWILTDRGSGEGDRVFQLIDGPGAPAAEAPRALVTDDHIEIRRKEQPVLRYNKAMVPAPAGVADHFSRNAYIHPVWTPAGQVVSGDFAGDHPHQRGVFLAWTKTAFADRQPDFWNLGKRTGTVRFAEQLAVDAGPVYARFRVRHEFVDLKADADAGVVLNEIWDVRVWNTEGPGGRYALWDLTSVQTCASDRPLVLPTYHYGGMALRGPNEWRGERCRFLTSEGRTRQDGNRSRGAWGDLSGRTDDAWAGLALISHPSVPRFPQPFRIHPEVPYFCFAPSQLGSWRIEPSLPLVMRYRIAVHDGVADAAELDRLYASFSDPPEVQFTAGL